MRRAVVRILSGVLTAGAALSAGAAGPAGLIGAKVDRFEGYPAEWSPLGPGQKQCLLYDDIKCLLAVAGIEKRDRPGAAVITLERPVGLDEYVVIYAQQVPAGPPSFVLANCSRRGKPLLAVAAALDDTQKALAAWTVDKSRTKLVSIPPAGVTCEGYSE